MYLLSTDRAELRFFPSVEAAQRARFAILSHVWGESEQSFQETQALAAHCGSINENPLDHCSEKVRESCKYASVLGYDWIWNDTCCIDKSSSADLSEAINSMFSYYAHAEVCFAYLADVPPIPESDIRYGRTLESDLDDSMSDTSSSSLSTVDALCRWPVLGDMAPYSRDLVEKADFLVSRWFKRGWTLQELVAPTFVIFLHSDWRKIDTKANIADVLSRITGIPETVLQMKQDIWSTSIAQRMSWAASRETTRPEDEAYCLMGIFDINMPPLYGEGRKAFRRLQEEIMKKSVDTSLFAWRVARVNDWTTDAEKASLLAPSPAQFSPTDILSFTPDTLYKLYARVSEYIRQTYPLVKFGLPPIGGSFRTVDPSGGTVPNSFTSWCPEQSSDDVSSTIVYPTKLAGVPAFDITPYGIRARLPVLELSPGIAAGILFVTDGDGEPLWFELEECNTVIDRTRPLYRVHCTERQIHRSSETVRLRRVIELANGLYSLDTPDGRKRWERFFTSPWQEIYFAHNLQLPLSRLTTVTLRLRRPAYCFLHDAISYIVPPGLILDLERRVFGFKFLDAEGYDTVEHTQQDAQRKCAVTALILFEHRALEKMEDTKYHILLRLGACSSASKRSYHHDLARGCQWVMVDTVTALGVDDHDPYIPEAAHDCATDHVKNWPDYTRSFPLNRSWSLVLTFAPDDDAHDRLHQHNHYDTYKLTQINMVSKGKKDKEGENED